MRSPTVYVVDDDADVRTALARLLRSAGREAVTFESPRTFLASFDRSVPACLLLDLTMPAIDGLELQRMLETEARLLPVVFLTGHGDVAASVQAMKRGAIDFLIKPVDDDLLLAAVTQALACAQALHDSSVQQRRDQARLEALTSREREVLEGIMAGKLNKQIAAQLGTVEKTIKFHRGNLMRKLNLRTVAELVKFAERAGVGKSSDFQQDPAEPWTKVQYKDSSAPRSIRVQCRATRRSSRSWTTMQTCASRWCASSRRRDSMSRASPPAPNSCCRSSITCPAASFWICTCRG